MKINLNKNLSKSVKSGFTLIELLVVVAIIGILASVVLASLTSARSKGKDAAIFAQLSNIRAQAELYYSTNGNYGVSAGAAEYDCTGGGSHGGAMFTGGAATGGLNNLLVGIGNTLNGTGALADPGDAVCNYLPLAAPVTSWAIAVKGSSVDTFYCVDSTGTSKSYTIAGGTVVGAAGAGAVGTGLTVCN